MKNKIIDNRGITLIALIVTIIVLIILAGVAIATLIGDNGLLTKAGESKEKNAYSKAKEQVMIVMNEYQIDYKIGNITDDSSITNWLGNQKNNLKSIEDYTYDGTTKIMGLKKDGYMFHFNSDGTAVEMYNIKYELNGGTNGENAVTTYSKGDTVQLPVPTKEGSQFLGWSKSNNDTENTILNITSEMEGDITLYACWLEETSKDYFKFTTNSDGKTATITSFSDLGIQMHDAGEIKNLVLPIKDKNGLIITTIGSSAFSGKNKIEKLIIPDTITIINGWEPFKNCTGIKYLRIPISLWVSDNNSSTTFNGVTNIEEVYFSKGTGEGINYSATTYQYTPWYLSRGKLTKVTLEKGITSIGNYMFCGCNNIVNTWKEIINNREDLTNIGIYAFNGCEKITGELSFPNKVTEIGAGTFTGCIGISSLIIPDTVIKINEWQTFKDCTGIKYLKIPISITFIADDLRDSAFSGVTNVEEVYFSKGNGTGANYVNSTNKVMHYEYTPWYKSKEKLTKVTLEKGITSIGNYMFCGCKNITNTWEELINNREELTNIGTYAFKECEKITGELSFPNKVTEIGDGTFTSCKGITSLIIPDTVIKINEWKTFKDCTGIKYLKMPISISLTGDDIKDNIFSGVTNVEQVYFSKGNGTGANYVNSVNKAMHYEYTPWYKSKEKLTKVTLEKGITSIGNYRFNGCNNITEIKFTGTEAEWNSVNKGTNNNILSTVTVDYEY